MIANTIYFLIGAAVGFVVGVIWLALRIAKKQQEFCARADELLKKTFRNI